MPAKFEASALFEFLGRVDRELVAPSIIFLIGGSAVSIIDPAHSTSDVDLQATEVVGPRRRFALALLDLIARLFGDDEANKHRPLLDKLAW